MKKHLFNLSDDAVSFIKDFFMIAALVWTIGAMLMLIVGFPAIIIYVLSKP